jgi:hypothetical protein
VPQGQVWTGSITIPAATPSSVLPITWTAFDNLNPIGSWYNNQASGTLQATGTVTVQGTGVALGQLTAYFSGISTDAASAPPWWPNPTPAPPPSTPKTIVSNAVPLGTPTTQIGSDQPVVVGTSLEIFEAAVAPFGGGPGGAARLQMLWSVDGSFVDPIEYDFDIALNANMRGLILPHLAPFVRFNAIRSAGATQMSLTVFTGLAAIVRPPIVPAGVLLTAQGNLAGNATATIPFLYPYTGPAVLSVLLQNASGTAGVHGFWVDCNGTNYAGTSFSWAHAIVDWVSDNTGAQAAVIQPRVIHVPPLVNSVVLTSQNPNTVGYTVSVVPLGP